MTNRVKRFILISSQANYYPQLGTCWGWEGWKVNKEQQEILELWEKLSLDNRRELIEVFLEELSDYPTMDEVQEFIDGKYELLNRDAQSRIDKVRAKCMSYSTAEDFYKFLWSEFGDKLQADAENQTK